MPQATFFYRLLPDFMHFCWLLALANTGPCSSHNHTSQMDVSHCNIKIIRHLSWVWNFVHDSHHGCLSIKQQRSFRFVMCVVKLDLRNGPQWSIDFPCKAMLSYRLCESSADFWSRAAFAYYLWRSAKRGLWAALKHSTIGMELPHQGTLNILHGLSCKTFSWGSVKIKRRWKCMFVGRPERVHTTVTVGPLQHVLLGWSGNTVAYVHMSVQSQLREREEKAPTGRTVSSVI